MYRRIKIAYWIACFFFLFIFYRWIMPDWKANLTVSFVNLGLFIFLSEAFLHFKAIPSFFYKKKYSLFLWSIIACLIINGTATLFATWTILQPYSKSAYNELFWAWENLIYGSFFVVAAFIAFSICTKLIYDWLAIQKRMDNLEKEKARAELSFLKAQLNPHFLFNSINSIFGHIDKNNVHARTMLLQFSDMLRYQLYECNTDKIDIDKEVSYLKNFIELQKKRKNETLKTTTQLEGNLNGFDIAPLVFIPFLENAFKYVSNYEGKPNYITIQLKREDGKIHFTCINSRDSLQEKKIMNTSGIGLQNIERRLNLMYPEKYDLKVEKTDYDYKVYLKIEF